MYFSSLGPKSLRDQLYVSESNRTFENDDKLPNLPLPELRNSLDLYLDTVRPVVDNEQFAVTEKIVKEFENGIGQKLQQKLVQRAQNCKNWLEEWWFDYAYLYNRGPLIPLSHMSGPMPVFDFWPPQPGSRIDRLSLNLFFSLEFWKLLRTEKMRPMINKGVAWDMSQFRNLFNTCRLPGAVKDTLVCPFRTETEGAPAATNVIVTYRGHIFSFNAIDENEEPLTPQEIAFQLHYIENWCQAQKPGPGIGSLTVDKRSEWAKNRQYLQSLNKRNVENLDKIENSLMVIVLDDSEPVSQGEVLQEVMCGDCSDRWADKSMCLISFKNGICGASADHTPFDGLCTAVFTHYVMTSINEIKGVYKGCNKFRELKRPERIEFIADEKILAEIEKVKSEYHTVCSNIDINHSTFDNFGKAILRNHRFHPEAFIQTALQLSYYRMYGKPAPTYCTASTRQFYHGRTETCRSCFPEAVDFAKAVVQGTASQPGELYLLLSKSVKKFQRVMNEAMKNEGCDRHFLGLYVTCLEEGIELPELFTDPSFLKSGGGGNYILSTSCSGYWSICGGVPPMRDDGYGCFYGIEDNKITFCTISFKNCSETNSLAFYNNIRMSLLDMLNILNSSKL